jgi:ubiquinone/menaquinone biosynthesis C-methylase UbiE
MDERAPNICAGPFGALYNFYIERPRLMRAIGRMVWGIDASVLYDSMRPLAEIDDGMTVLDVPCGGGIAFRALPQGRNIRYAAVDIDEAMLARARLRAQRRGLEAEFVAGDMLKLPLDDGAADLVLSYSGLHMVSDPERAVQELARCLKPGGHNVPRRRDVALPGPVRNRCSPGTSAAACPGRSDPLAEGRRHPRCDDRPPAWVRRLQRPSRIRGYRRVDLLTGTRAS